MVDEESECIAVTVYNYARGKGVIIGNTVAIPDPFVEVVDFTFKDKVCARGSRTTVVLFQQTF
jgi:uncharacterized membrane protein